MKLGLLGLSFLISFGAFAQKIEEEVFVKGFDKKQVKLIEANPELIIDHAFQDGFELYGPKGMKEWLKNVGIDFVENLSHSHHKSAEDAADYPSYQEITKFLKDITAKYPKIASLKSIGKSVEGRELWVVKISDNVNTDEREPEFKYISSMHGDEITGRELTQFLIKDLLEAYGNDPSITELIDNTEIYIMPSMNPDGSQRRQRANANGYDLNRNFPEYTRNDQNTSNNRQPETVAVMNFQSERNFALSANFHGGAVVVNYPWDATYSKHPFDKLVKDISLRYAGLNSEMRNSREFNDGVTNGADWYVLRGGMQDWSYAYHNDLQVTVELSDTKWPRYREIPGFYDRNKDSMIEYIKAVHQGAGFKLADRNATGKVSIIKVLGPNASEPKGSYGFGHGEFYKVLEEGKYRFNVLVDGESSRRFFEVTVKENTVYVDGNYTEL
tara:strand:- start:57033 stop:58358 length:1326 start_codon:yes stop_codon:yes gene_type:complete